MTSPSRADPTVVRSVLVVGGGICGSTTAAVLAQAGLEVTLFEPRATHEGHLAAALTPVISSDDNVRSRLSRLGANLADRYWRSLQAATGAAFGACCGALQLQRPESAKRAQDLKAQAQAFNQPDWARWVEREQASELAGLDLPRGAIWFPGGWQVEVPLLVQALQATQGVTLIPQKVSSLEQAGSGWLVRDESGQPLVHGDALVLASAFDVPGLLQRSGLGHALEACRRLPALHRLAGEVTLLPAAGLAGGPTCIVGGDGYVLPAIKGWCVSGGTYLRAAELAQCTEAGKKANIARASELLGIELAPEQPDNLPGWAGWRAVLPGRLPAIGKLPHLENLWVFTAGASRGLTWSVLGAELIRDGLVGGSSLEGSMDAAMALAICP